MSDLTIESDADNNFQSLPLATRAAAEFIGTFILIFGAISTAIGFGQSVGPLGIAIAFGLALIAAISALDHISDAHFNPAVSIALAAIKRFKWSEVPVYIVAQVLGATAAALLVTAIFPDRIGTGATVFGKDVGAWTGLLAEITAVAIFLFVIAGVESRKAKTSLYSPLIIGLTLTLLHLSVMSVTGAGLNPARWFGPALVAGEWSNWWVYIVGPIIGGLIGAGLFRALSPHRYQSK